MFQEYFGFIILPFSKSIKPSELFPSREMKELHARLSYLLDQRGIGLITGEVGSGKSTLVRAFVDNLERPLYNLVYIADPSIGSRGLYRECLSQMGIEPAYFRWDLLARLKTHLLKSYIDQRKITLLLIDEAQLLPIRMLEELRLLTNFQMDSQSPLCLILLGQPDLRKRMKLQSLEALNQRITVKYHLFGLSREETSSYISHQLKIAGRRDHLFSDDAIERIFQESKGIPRLINIICTYCLIAAATEKKNIIDEKITRKVIQDLEDN